jgi:hypothetical protein
MAAITYGSYIKYHSHFLQSYQDSPTWCLKMAATNASILTGVHNKWLIHMFAIMRRQIASLV